RRHEREAGTATAPRRAVSMRSASFRWPRSRWAARRPGGGGGLNRLDSLDDRAVHPVGDFVRELDRDVRETRGLEPSDVLSSGQRAGDTADVASALGSLLGREAIFGEYVGDAGGG